MGQTTHSISDTRYRILEASGEIFAEFGFRDATVMRICERAGVTLATVNYYLREKEGFYSEVLKYWFEVAIKRYPPLLGVTEDTPLEDRIRAFIKSFLLRILDKEKPTWFGKLMAREMMEPTQALDSLIEEIIRPLHKLLGSIVQEMIGTPVNEETIRSCCVSIISQCLYYYNTRFVVERLFQRDMCSPDEIDGIADHITRFTLNGLKHYLEDNSEKGK